MSEETRQVNAHRNHIKSGMLHVLTSSHTQRSSVVERGIAVQYS